MNISVPDIEEGSDTTKEVVIGSFGLLIFSLNLIILVIISKLVSNDKHGIIVQFLFVTTNDVLCGLVLFVKSFVRLSSQTMVNLCVYIILISLALQIVSQGNIVCICAQRYFYIRNLRKITTPSSIQTKVLIAVNVIIGVVSLTVFIINSQIKDVAEIPSRFCILTPILRDNVVYVTPATFVLGITFILVSNVICVKTILALRQQVNIAVLSKATEITSVKVPNNSGQTDERTTAAMRSRQQRAIKTLLLIVICFDLSSIPNIVTFILIFLGQPFSNTARAYVYASYFLNSIANPIIIAKRTEDVRNSLLVLFVCIKTKLFAR